MGKHHSNQKACSMAVIKCPCCRHSPMIAFSTSWNSMHGTIMGNQILAAINCDVTPTILWQGQTPLLGQGKIEFLLYCMKKTSPKADINVNACASVYAVSTDCLLLMTWKLGLRLRISQMQVLSCTWRITPKAVHGELYPTACDVSSLFIFMENNVSSTLMAAPHYYAIQREVSILHHTKCKAHDENPMTLTGFECTAQTNKLSFVMINPT